MSGIFHIRPVSVGLDTPFSQLFIYKSGYLNVRKMSEMMDFRSFVVPLIENSVVYQISATSYPAFLSSVQELNAISEHFLDSNGKQLVFAVKKGTDSTILWKATVR